NTGYIDPLTRLRSHIDVRPADAEALVRAAKPLARRARRDFFVVLEAERLFVTGDDDAAARIAQRKVRVAGNMMVHVTRRPHVKPTRLSRRRREAEVQIRGAAVFGHDIEAQQPARADVADATLDELAVERRERVARHERRAVHLIRDEREVR